MDKPYQLLPPLTAEERALLKEAIRNDGGVLVPVVLDEFGNIIDGHHRVELWHELRAEGVMLPDYPRIIIPGLSEAEKRAMARTLNVARRQLTPEQRRRLIEDQLRETPEQSNRQIAKALGVDHVTVGNRRDHLESTGEIHQLDKTVGADGKSRPARRPTVFCKNGSEAKKATRLLEAVPVEELPHVGDVRQLARIGRQHRLDNVPEVPAVQTIGAASLRVGSFLDALADVPDGTVDLILTDPPYAKESLPDYENLAVLGSRLLKDELFF